MIAVSLSYIRSLRVSNKCHAPPPPPPPPPGLFSIVIHALFSFLISFLEQFTKESLQSHMCILLGILNSFPCSQRAFWRKAGLSLSHAGLLLNSESERTYVEHTHICWIPDYILAVIQLWVHSPPAFMIASCVCVFAIAYECVYAV